jgi:hypothetical protein
MLRDGLRDDQWDRIKEFLPGREGHVGVPCHVGNHGPGANAAATIVRFCSSLHGRRRSGPVIM